MYIRYERIAFYQPKRLRLRYSTLTTWLLLFFVAGSYGQNQTALPQVVNYHSYDYKAGVQNWSIAQDQSGILYFGNSEGLLTFDGKFWRKYPLPNQTIVRAVKVGSDGKIYVGGQDELGYFSPDQQGRLQYHSFNHLVPAGEKQFSDIWSILEHDGSIFFHSKNSIFLLKDGVIKVYKPNNKWAYMGLSNNQVYAQEYGAGLLKFDHGTWKPIGNNPDLIQTPISAILPYGKDTNLVVTLKKGLYLLHQEEITKKVTEIDERLHNDRIYCAQRVNDEWLALGSNANGVFIIDKFGHLVQTFAYAEGLQKNNTRSMLLDRNKNLWIGLDDGIDQVAINSAVKFIYPDKRKQVTGYATRIFQNHLYVGTSNGLYATKLDITKGDLSLSDSKFFEVPNTTGQIWSLEELNDHLFIGHEEGAMVVKNQAASRLYTGTGSWQFRPGSQVFPAKDIIAGTYTGLRHIKFNGTSFEDHGQLQGVPASLRFISFDNAGSTVWASHPNHGIYKIDLTPDLSKIQRSTLLGQNAGLPADRDNYIYRVKNRIVVTAQKGVYEYNPAKQKFEESALLNGIFKNRKIQYLHEDKQGNIWFISNKRTGVIDFSKPTKSHPYTLVDFPELAGLTLGGYESIYSWNDENIFIAGNKGIIHVNYKKYRNQTARPDVHIGQVRLPGANDSTLYGGYGAPNSKKPPYLSHKNNAVHFEFASTMYEQLRNIEFSYQLEGFDENWSAWTNRSEKDYTNLPPGDYTFKVKARNNWGSESSVVSYTFEVGAAWYDSILMYLIYVVALVALLYYILRWQKKKHRAEQAHLRYLHQLELDRNEKEIIQLKNQKLETDISFKNSELLTMTINLVQRGEVLKKIKDNITALMKLDSGEHTPAFRNLLKQIREVEKSNEDWDQFSIHFNNVNFDFFNDLKRLFPEVTPNDLKLCAYLRMNLSTKEIAQLLNITLKAVEIARYRLRKKLQLMPDTNLSEFLMHLPKEQKV
ncbi:YXYXY domain-containing protein [Chitinophaga skermanii]|uniref:YXYXY domain-containing protein n=1 Tax=Chitinophaga skermanii TaxID=331697 RepID=A0A327R6A7_9BACT|nr:YXYXY domain-containing protein [Chitinophaga skermanii]